MSFFAAGELRHRLTLEAGERSADEGGGATVSWVAVADLWGRITPTVGREMVRADGLGARVTHEIVLRHRAGVLPQMRLRLGSRIFEIHAVIDVAERRRWLRCLCEEAVP